MTNAIVAIKGVPARHWRVVSTIFAATFILTGCLQSTKPVPAPGTPVSETDILEFMSGASWNTTSGARFHAADGTTKSFINSDTLVQACEGTWSVSGSILRTKYRCNWQENGKSYFGSFRDQEQEIFWSNDKFVAVDTANDFTGHIYFSERVEGFPRAGEFDRISTQVGL